MDIKMETSLNNPNYPQVDIWVKEAIETYDYLVKDKKIVIKNNIITIDGVDYSGKSEQIKLLAKKLKEQGEEVVIVKGSGTTGADEMLEWSQNNIVNGELRKFMVEQLSKLNDMQQTHHQLAAEIKRLECNAGVITEAIKEKIEAIKKEINDLIFGIQVAQFKLMSELSEKEDITIISDRGFVSALLGIIEYQPQRYKEILEVVRTQVDKFVVGRNILLSIGLDDVADRSEGKIGRVGGLGQTDSKLGQRIEGFKRFYEAKNHDSPKLFQVVDGSGSIEEVGNEVLKVLSIWMGELI